MEKHSDIPELEDLGLQPPLQEVLGLESQDVIETHTGVVKDTNSNKTTDQSVTLEKTLGVLVLELEELTGSTTNLRSAVFMERMRGHLL